MIALMVTQFQDVLFVFTEALRQSPEDFEFYYKGRKQMAIQAHSITQSSVPCQKSIQNSLAETAVIANLIQFWKLVRKHDEEKLMSRCETSSY